VKGQSGNPAGCPRGSTSRATRAAELLLDGEAIALTRKAVELARAGDPAALRLCLECTVRHAAKAGRSRSAADPQLKRYLGCDKSGRRRGSRGGITPGEAVALSRMIEAFLRAIDASDVENRLRKLGESYRAIGQDPCDPAGMHSWAVRRGARPTTGGGLTRVSAEASFSC
jgi:hypothetical protein